MHFLLVILQVQWLVRIDKKKKKESKHDIWFL